MINNSGAQTFWRGGLMLLMALYSLSAQASSLLPAAGSPVVIDAAFPGEAPLGSHLDLYEDREAALDIEAVVAAARQGLFQRSQREELSLGTTAAAWWGHLSLENRSDQPRQLILQQGYPLIDHLQLWESVDGELQQRVSGDTLPFSTREIATNALTFVLDLEPNSRHDLFLRYQTDGAMSIDLKLFEPIPFVESMVERQVVQGLFCGALLALAIYNLFIFAIVRDNSYLLYVIYILTFGIFIAGFSGYSAQYLWPESPWLANTGLLISWGAVIATALIFSQNFLGMRHHSPQLNLIANLFIAVGLGCSAAALFLPYAAVIKVLFLLAPPAYLLILIAAYKGIQRGYTPARYFMTAWGLLMVSAIIGTLISAGVIKEFASYSYKIIEWGAFFEMVLLSIALASRIRNLEQESLTDELTKLFNRRFFDQQLNRSLDLAQRQQRPVSLMVVDVDHFKSFNDTFGHSRGDMVLRRVGELLLKAARRSDYVCRYGGEEFAVILPNTDRHSGLEVAERMRQQIADETIEEQQITVSIGLASSDGTLDENELFRRADVSLYEAKQSGRNRVIAVEGRLATASGV